MHPPLQGTVADKKLEYIHLQQRELLVDRRKTLPTYQGCIQLAKCSYLYLNISTRTSPPRLPSGLVEITEQKHRTRDAAQTQARELTLL